MAQVLRPALTHDSDNTMGRLDASRIGLDVMLERVSDGGDGFFVTLQ
jgi:hypothetical protein